jgi:hypothetical protein
METLQGEVPEIVWWRLLNVAWVATEREFPAGAPVERVDVEGGPPLYRVLVDAPPVWVAPADATAMPPGDPAFDPRGGIDPAASSAVLESFGSLRASATVRLDSPGLAVLSTAFAPGWRASATGSAGEELGRLPVVAAYGALVATPLPAGEWQIRWTYLPGSLILGAAISVLAAVTGGAIWLRTRSPRP